MKRIIEDHTKQKREENEKRNSSEERERKKKRILSGLPSERCVAAARSELNWTVFVRIQTGPCSLRLSPITVIGRHSARYRPVGPEESWCK